MFQIKSELAELYQSGIRHVNYRNLKWAINSNESIIGRYPLNVQIQTVSKCNGKCRFCPYQGSWHNLNPGVMSWTTYKRIIANLKQYQIEKFCPYLENEPLLDRDIFEKILFAAENLNPKVIEIATNLTVLTQDMLRAVKEILCRFPHIIIVSFHGVSKESYKEIMGLSYENTMNNIFNLVELSQEIPLNVTIRGAGMPRYDGFGLKQWFGEEEYVAFFKKKFARFPKKPQICFFTYHDRAGAKQLSDKGMSFNSSFRDNLDEFYCTRFDRWLHFLYTGEPILCCMDYNRETVFGEGVELETFEDMCSSDKFLNLVRKGVGMLAAEKDFICKRCSSPGG